MKRNLTIKIVSPLENTDLEYWLSRSENERIEAMELLRRQWWASLGHDEFPRMEKVITLRSMDEIPK